MRFRPSVFVILTHLLSLFAVGFPPLSVFAESTQAVDSSKHSVLRIGFTGYPSSIMPIFAGEWNARFVSTFSLRAVTTENKNHKIECILCVDLPTFENGLAKLVSENGNSLVRVEYTLKDNLFWGDGSKVSSDDVLFTLAAHKEKSLPVYNAQIYEQIVRAEKIDDRRFYVYRSAVSIQYNSLSELFLLNSATEKPIFDQDPSKYNLNSNYIKNPTLPQLYSGPYLMSVVTPDQKIEYIRNPYWQGAKPQFQKIILNVLSNSATLQMALRSGDIDMISGEGGLSASAIQRAGPAFLANHKMVRANYGYYMKIALNNESLFLKDKRVRKALSLAVDRQLLVQKILNNSQKVVAFPYSLRSDGENGFNQKEANRLLDDSGWRFDGKKRTNKLGQELRLSLSIGSSNAENVNVAVAMATMWAHVGVTVDIATMNIGMLVDKLTQGKFEMLFLGRGLDFDPAVPFAEEYGTKSIPTAQNNWRGSNDNRFARPEIDSLAAQLQVTLDPEARTKIINMVEDIFNEEQPEIPLYFKNEIAVVPKNFQITTAASGSAPSSLFVEHWRWLD